MAVSQEFGKHCAISGTEATQQTMARLSKDFLPELPFQAKVLQLGLPSGDKSTILGVECLEAKEAPSQNQGLSFIPAHLTSTPQTLHRPDAEVVWLTPSEVFVCHTL